jgi:hypothetical protein
MVDWLRDVKELLRNHSQTYSTIVNHSQQDSTIVNHVWYGHSYS